LPSWHTGTNIVHNGKSVNFLDSDAQIYHRNACTSLKIKFPESLLSSSYLAISIHSLFKRSTVDCRVTLNQSLRKQSANTLKDALVDSCKYGNETYMGITNIDNILHEFNNIRHKIKFTIEKEENSRINFLDLSINRTANSIELAIYRKPTTTDLTIHNDSCHPSEHKKNAINYLFNRINHILSHSRTKKKKNP
jgi:hypothetical protein